MTDPEHASGAEVASQEEIRQLCMSTQDWLMMNGTYIVPEGANTASTDFPIRQRADYFSTRVSGDAVRQLLPELADVLGVNDDVELTFTPSLATKLDDGSYDMSSANCVFYTRRSESSAYVDEGLCIYSPMDGNTTYRTGRTQAGRADWPTTIECVALQAIVDSLDSLVSV